MWNPFASKVAQDTNEVIFLDEEGLLAYPLICDQELYEKCMEKIKEMIREWMIQDATYTTQLNQSSESSLVFQFKEIDLKYLAYPTQFETLLNCMKDTEINMSGSRFMDNISRIYTYMPLEVIRVFQGRFLVAMLKGLPRIINETPLPTKEMWRDLFMVADWVPFLLIVQDLFDNDEIVNKLNQIVQTNKQFTTNVVSTPMRSH